MTEEKTPLTVEIAQRMYATGRDLPEYTMQDIRTRYEAMANEARVVITEKLDQYAASVGRICVEKQHVGSKPSTGANTTDTPCGQCRKQIRYMRSAMKIVDPNSGA